MLRVLRKVLLLIACLALLGVIGVTVFITTFNADRYRPLVVERLERALGKPVRLERIALSWQQGLAIQLQGLVIEAGEAPAQEPLLSLESARAIVRLWPLLRKNVQVASLALIRPRIRVVRERDGRINLVGLAAAVSPTAAASRPASFGDAEVSFRIASLRIDQGTLHWTDEMTTPPMELWARGLDVTVENIAPGEPMDLTVRCALGGSAEPAGSSAPPTLQLSARLLLPTVSGAGSLDAVHLAIDRLALEPVMPPVPAGQAKFIGTLSGTLEGRVPTLDPALLARAISVNGRIQLVDAALLNVNLLREVFAKLSMIPGLMERLQAKLPPEAQAKLTSSDTRFSSIELPLTLERGVLQLEALRVRTDAFGVSGSGTVGLDGALALRTTLSIDRAFSDAIIRSVAELAPLANPAGEIELPLAIQGRAPTVTVLPDLHYVTSKVLVTSAVDLLGELLKKHKGAENAAPEGSAASGTTTTSPTESTDTPPSSAQVLDSLLGRALQRALKSKSSDSSAPAP